MYQYLLFLILAIGVFTGLLYLIMFLMDLIGTPASSKAYFESSDKLTVNVVPLKVNRELPEPLIWYTLKGEDSSENRRVSGYIKNIKEFLKGKPILKIIWNDVCEI
ncbi:PREDICTED: uncharacterized protein LOC108568050 [Nicrophorus vespilloides]|uniref:Uncharacterized protein LOC108568050 n=1 Tax=Nicrophorus vespilloides TaxID=110193 RepID=A0ABM1NC48_NICVS|nr:PREDICTED: uncharacterized protein LOC108568050 [Nicrophorus vespilloides]